MVSPAFFVVDKSPETWLADLAPPPRTEPVTSDSARDEAMARDYRDDARQVVTLSPWQRRTFQVGQAEVTGRASWGAGFPKWENEIVYYNTSQKSLQMLYSAIVVHHSNNTGTVSENEAKHLSQGYAALGYHFFIQRDGVAFQGRPVEVMGSHAGVGVEKGPLNDPDWAKIGIVLQGDYEDTNWVPFDHNEISEVQIATLKALIQGLASEYVINTLFMHREVPGRKGDTVCPGSTMVPVIEALRIELGMAGA